MDLTVEKDVIDLCGLTGKVLLENGAETSRVESTVEYIGRAAGINVNCHATMTAIFVDSEDNPTTHLVKVRVGDFNLQKVDEINTLSRQFTKHEISYDELKEHVHLIDNKVIDFNWWQKILGAGLVSIAPMLLFKATWLDLGLSFFVGICGYLAAHWVSDHSSTPYINVGVGGLVIGLLATLLQLLGVAQSADNIIISSLMPLVPGVAITNSIREIIQRHTISGLVRAVDAIMVAGSIGAGVVVGSTLIQWIGGLV